MTLFINWLYRSIWPRVFVPVALIGVNGLTINLLSWDATSQGVFTPSAITRSPFFYIYILSALLLTVFEFGRAKLETSSDDYGKRLLDAVQPDIQNLCKDLVKQGKIDEVYQHAEKGRLVYNSTRKRKV